jgi:hypothetical protein
LVPGTRRLRNQGARAPSALGGGAAIVGIAITLAAMAARTSLGACELLLGDSSVVMPGGHIPHWSPASRACPSSGAEDRAARGLILAREIRLSRIVEFCQWALEFLLGCCSPCRRHDRARDIDSR